MHIYLLVSCSFTDMEAKIFRQRSMYIRQPPTTKDLEGQTISSKRTNIDIKFDKTSSGILINTTQYYRMMSPILTQQSA